MDSLTLVTGKHELIGTVILKLENFFIVATILLEKMETAAFNISTPNVNYSWRTAPLTFKVSFYIFIQQI